MQVIHELRNVHVKLRKVASSELSQSTLRRRHVEYELTPFEILLEQIRARKYSLKKVTVNAHALALAKKVLDETQSAHSAAASINFLARPISGS